MLDCCHSTPTTCYLAEVECRGGRYKEEGRGGLRKDKEEGKTRIKDRERAAVRKRCAV